MIIKKNINNKSFFSSLASNLWKTSKNISKNFINLFRKKHNINVNFFNSLKETLIISDIGIKTTNDIVNKTIQYSKLNNIQYSDQLYNFIKQEMFNILSIVEKPLIINSMNKPFIILIFGINGVGKTTTIGKLAYYFYKQNKSVYLASGDTFRAGANEQLKIWSYKSNSYIINNNKIHDSSAVIYDAIVKTKKDNIDILIIDTAGRLHNNISLLEELKKNVRVIKKKIYDAPNETMLILDSNIGQNSINQFKIFNKHINITGITITKLDGTAKGGVIFSLANEFKIPIRYICTGEQIQDLHLFNAENFINTIFTKN
ncbi:signal recognition particle-docking protein FtsY [Enterobacteriaceae endosymbiont of Neohaemonia nigricornis]|uniref:signal recognition particle-docking protein FtsY n=1 Tax=Enterobacteriaceae endosymbiont of Neohaemonia nigricornis TaxID=2675792 RepID=UPI0014493C79|nr:signal recognition particle-docking protein FtsY [Enterobacteriaceae endosymbiont of Neohaemonia nigricornis]QJC30234.1 signal recognition particle-docking protein FtsY [Enterobacteriaceae endosymbiont of Neohaemonia nigricornis]